MSNNHKKTPAANDKSPPVEQNTAPAVTAEAEKAAPEADASSDAEAQAALAKADAEAAKAIESTEGLVKVRKGDETLYVHPTTVEAHKSVGWTLA